MADVKRICDLCKEDATPKKPWGGIAIVKNRRGVGIGLFCGDCYGIVNKIVDESPRSYSKWSDATMNKLIMERAELVKKGSNGPTLGQLLYDYQIERVDTKEKFMDKMVELNAIPDGFQQNGGLTQTNYRRADGRAVGRHSWDSQGDIYEIIYPDRC